MWIIILFIILIALLIYGLTKLVRLNLRCLEVLTNIDNDYKKEQNLIINLSELVRDNVPREVKKLNECLDQKITTIYQKANTIDEIIEIVDKIFEKIDEEEKNSLELRTISIEIKNNEKNMLGDIELYNIAASEYNNFISKPIISILSKILKYRKKQLFTNKITKKELI